MTPQHWQDIAAALDYARRDALLLRAVAAHAREAARAAIDAAEQQDAQAAERARAAMEQICELVNAHAERAA